MRIRAARRGIGGHAAPMTPPLAVAPARRRSGPHPRSCGGARHGRVVDEGGGATGHAGHTEDPDGFKGIGQGHGRQPGGQAARPHGCARPPDGRASAHYEHNACITFTFASTPCRMVSATRVSGCACPTGDDHSLSCTACGICSRRSTMVPIAPRSAAAGFSKWERCPPASLPWATTASPPRPRRHVRPPRW